MPTIQFHSLLDEEARWQIRDGHQIRVADALKQYCRANAALEVKRGEVASIFGTLVSAGCSHIAAIEIVTSLKIIKVTVYRLENGFQHEWNASYSGSEEEFRRPATLATYETDQFQGGITEDGRSVLMFFGNKAESTEAYLVNANGFTRRTPPPHIFTQYLPPTGQLSEDSEYLFYSTHGRRFGRNGQAEVVEAYSIRHLARMRAHTFGFGDGYHHRNTNLISPLRFEGAIYMTIVTASYDGPDDGRRSPLVLASSDKKIQWNCADVEDSDRAFISPDNAHLFYVEHNTARLRHWDLNNPTLRALGSTILPGVEQSPRRKWLIRGKETMLNDAIPEQMHRIRFSPKCKVATVVTVNDRSIAINVLLTFNLQLIYHRTVLDPSWPYLIPTSIGFTESIGLNVFAMQAALTTDYQQGLVGFSGIRGVLISLPEIFTKIKAIEDYFDTLGDRLTTLVKQVVSVEARPECKFEWRPGYLERDVADAISHQSGSSPQTTEVDERRQRRFYERVYANPKSSTKMNSSPSMWRYFVPHLFSFHYRWDREKTVSVFGAVMKYTYYVIAIGPASSTADHGNEVIRILYTSDISVRAENNEYIEVYRSGPNHFLRVYKRRNQPVGYSGAPMPSPRWTVLSPHFLEEDAWYDTFIIHQGTHVTMPNEWVQSPGSVLIESTNNQAFFEPYTYSTMSVINYGHRARPAYTVPKYLLWKEYGLRRRRKPHVNEPWFGSGPYADIVGKYLKSIYEDKTYDDSAPLFPTALALACHEDYRSQTTERVDAFFRRMHQDRNHLLNSCQAISCTLPIACRARPTASLSFMRHIVAYPHRVNDIGAVEVRDGATVPELGGQSQWRYWVKYILDVLAGAITDRLWDENAGDAEPYVSHITLPLPDFCSFRYKLYKLPSQSERDLSGDSFWTFIRAAYPEATEGHMPYWETYVLKAVQHSGAGAASPFTRLVEMILEIQDRELQLSFLRIPWLEKLLVWKMKAFGLRMYLTRTLVPMLMLFCLHLIACIWLTEQEVREIPFPVTVLACIEALVSSFILSVKIRQIYRIPRLFFRSIFNYVDGTALCLGFTMFFLVVSKTAPSRAFLGFSTLILWIGTILMLRIYRPIGMLLLMITETVQATFSFLVLLVFIIIGFAFVPFLLLRNTQNDASANYPFSSFPLTISHVINFISADYNVLEPFEGSSVAVRTIRAMYIVIITVLFLNIFIAILNLKIKSADRNARNLYHLQMASLQVEIELGLLSSSERARRDWFPTWFNYSITKSEKRTWDRYVETNPLKWTEENDYPESADHTPQAPLKHPSSPTTERMSVNTAGSGETAPISGAESVEPWANRPERDPPDDEQVQDDGGDTALANESDPNPVAPSEAVTPSSSNMHPCAVCGKPGKRCTGCLLTAYCGEEHQKQDLKIHKSACKGKQKAHG